MDRLSSETFLGCNCKTRDKLFTRVICGLVDRYYIGKVRILINDLDDNRIEITGLGEFDINTVQGKWVLNQIRRY